MLILSRRPGESIRIGEDVAITILGVKGSQVRLGITAPRSIPVHREEVYDRIHSELIERASNRHKVPGLITGKTDSSGPPAE